MYVVIGRMYEFHKNNMEVRIEDGVTEAVSQVFYYVPLAGSLA